jgi:hypothetical protein
VVRLAQARRHQSRQFEANRVVDLVRHGLNSAVLSALCQREAKDWERGACGAGAAGAATGTAGSGDPAYRRAPSRRHGDAQAQLPNTNSRSGHHPNRRRSLVR